jgi:isopropylmalate/homocitrate/citramalate synthase
VVYGVSQPDESDEKYSIPPSRVIINDETLWEGEETPGVFVTEADKVRVARALEAQMVPEMGVGLMSSM